MPRANRYFLSGHVWHITHRCHKKEFLLKFARDRDRWRYWLFEPRKRYGLCVLDYIITSNHIHLLVLDRGKGEIAQSMQLISGRAAQEYNRRKQRKGAFREDRYHATAIETNEYLCRCLVYIDLNMVRAGVIDHPGKWRWSGYSEIQNPPERYRVVDMEMLMKLFGIKNQDTLQERHREWVDSALNKSDFEHDTARSSCLAVGSCEYIDEIRAELCITERYRDATVDNKGKCLLHETEATYRADFTTEMGDLSK